MEEIIRNFPEEVGISTAALLLQIVYGEQAIEFHHTVAQLLFVSGRACQDIQTAVAFLRRRVKSPDEDDWEKLKRVIKYLNGKNSEVHTVGRQSLNNKVVC